MMCSLAKSFLLHGAGLRSIIWMIAALVLISCGHKHELSPAVLLAIGIQEQGISIANEVDSLLQLIGDDELKDRFRVQNDWLRSQMIEIEGAAHDHQSCHHDHIQLDYDVTQEEMIKIQSEWRDSLVSLQQQVSYVIQ